MSEDFFQGLVVFACVFLVFLLFFGAGIIDSIIKHREKMQTLKNQTQPTGNNVQKSLEEFGQRLDKIERRMANLESIALDTEKTRQFERLIQ